MGDWSDRLPGEEEMVGRLGARWLEVIYYGLIIVGVAVFLGLMVRMVMYVLPLG